jgi:hypothetical protein
MHAHAAAITNHPELPCPSKPPYDMHTDVPASLDTAWDVSQARCGHTNGSVRLKLGPFSYLRLSSEIAYVDWSIFKDLWSTSLFNVYSAVLL